MGFEEYCAVLYGEEPLERLLQRTDYHLGSLSLPEVG